MNPLLTKREANIAGYWPRSFCVFIDLYFVSINKNAKKNLANIQPT